jgi:hypothetical protein
MYWHHIKKMKGQVKAKAKDFVYTLIDIQRPKEKS